MRGLTTGVAHPTFVGMPTLLHVAALVMVASSGAVDGLELELRELSRTTSAWRALLRALCTALVLVPIGTLLIVRGSHLSGPLATGLVVLSVCPGGLNSPRHAKSFGGNFALAAELNAALGVLTALCAGPSARALLKYTGPLDLHPLRMIAKLILVQLVPLAIGLAFRHRWPGPAVRAKTVLKVLLIGATVAVVALAVLPQLPIIAAIGWTGVLGTIGTMALAVALGALMGDSGEASRTLAGLAAVLNVGLAIVIVTSAGAPSAVVAAIAGIFLLRVLLNLACSKVSALRLDKTHVTPRPSRA